MDDLTGKTIAGYQIIEQIGRGGMSTVFRAYQPSLDRDVAIKILPPYYSQQDDSFLTRFKREARSIAKLRHPNILMVMDFGQQDDLAYIVMEYVTAGTLRDRLKKPIALGEVNLLIGQIASALAYAHEQGIVHRDVKPSNIMLPKSDWALLTDFGLARMVGGSFLTQSGMTVGTPAYMSPEQGSGKTIDHRTDIYSLGVMLYEMVVGEVPYTAETPMAVVVKHIVEPLPMPRAKNPDIPEDLQRVILKALAKDPADRFQNINDLAKALSEIAQAAPTWSAGEMKAVSDTRGTPKDKPETLQMDEYDAVTIPPEVVPLDQKEIATTSETPTPQSDSKVSQPPAKSNKRGWLLAAGAVFLFPVFIILSITAINWLTNRDANDVADGNLPQITQTTSIDNPRPTQKPTLEQVPEEGLPPAGDEFQPITVLIELGEFDRARELARIALKNNPALWRAYAELVTVLEDKGEIEMAALFLQTGLETHPNPPAEAYNRLGWMYLSLTRPEDALPNFEKAVSEAPWLYDAHVGLVNAAQNVDQIEEEIHFLEGLEAKIKDEVALYDSLGNLHQIAGNTAKAVDYFELGMEVMPEDPWIWVDSYDAYLSLGDEDKALMVLEKSITLAPDDSILLSSAGWGFLNLERYKRAEDILLQAAELDPEDAWTQLGIGLVFMYTDKPTEQVYDHLHRAEDFARNTTDVWLLAEIGWAYVDYDDCKAAIPLFQMAEDLAPGLTDARDGLETCK